MNKNFDDIKTFFSLGGYKFFFQTTLGYNNKPQDPDLLYLASGVNPSLNPRGCLTDGYKSKSTTHRSRTHRSSPQPTHHTLHTSQSPGLFLKNGLRC